jgi:hypothetical protein
MATRRSSGGCLRFRPRRKASPKRLDDGDALAVQGALRAEAYAKDGEPRVNLTVLADALLPLRRPKKRQEPERQERAPVAEFDDPIPF